MAITGYFINYNWKFREILLGFEPLYRTHSSANLSTIIFSLLEKYSIINQVLAVTTNNTSNNNTMVESIQESINSLKLPNQTPIIRIPYLAHII